MKKTPIPPDEEQRLTALHALKILDTAPEDRFDRITRLAKHLFDVPIVLISLVDEDRQWSKSRHGIELAEIPREISFCGHAILGDGPFIIPDARKDERFSDNPLVTNEPHIRFYAGSPLAALDGSKVGTLCLIDRQPRELSNEEAELLKDLAGMVENELNLVEAAELQRKLAETKDERYRQSVENSPNPIFSVGKEGRIQSWNQACEQVLQYSSEEIIGQEYTKLLWDHGDVDDIEKTIKQVWCGKAQSDKDMVYRTKDGTRRYTVSRLYPVRDNAGNVRECVFANTDITERKST